MKASTSHNLAFLAQVLFALTDPRWRKHFTLRVWLTLSKLTKLGKLPDFSPLRVVCQKSPRENDDLRTPVLINTAPDFSIMNNCLNTEK